MTFSESTIQSLCQGHQQPQHLQSYLCAQPQSTCWVAGNLSALLWQSHCALIRIPNDGVCIIVVNVYIQSITGHFIVLTKVASEFKPALKSCLFIFILTENLKEFRAYVHENNEDTARIKELKSQVEKFASTFPMPGLEGR